MTIRFQCVSCKQPIEVDDEWMGKVVACPYCRNTVTAPMESSLTAETEVHVATPVLDQAPDVLNPQTGDPSLSAPPSPYPHSATTYAPLSRISIALVALGLSIAVMVQLFIFTAVLFTHKSEMKVFQDRVLELQNEGENLFAASQKAMMEIFGQDGAPPAWLAIIGLLQMSAGFTWLAAIICSLIAFSKPARRQYAIFSLGLLGIAPLVYCCGVGTAGM